MNKIINNLASSKDVSITSKFVYNNSIASSDFPFFQVTDDMLLFVKLSFDSSIYVPKINKLVLNLLAKVFYGNIIFKVGLIKNNDMTDSSLIKAYSDYMNSNNKNIIEHAIINGTRTSSSIDGEVQNIQLDLSNIFKSVTYGQEITVVIQFANIVDTLFIYSPQYMAKQNSVVVSGVISSVSGLSSEYKYDVNDFKECGQLLVNLCTGEPIYTLDLFQTSSKKNPINISIIQNQEKTESVKFSKYKILSPYRYRIYKSHTDYIVEDPTGYKSCYAKVEIPKIGKDHNELLKEYKHLTKEDTDLYINYFDYSYLIIRESNKYFLYDKYGNETKFIGSNIVEQINTLGYKYTYNYSGNRLDSIVNSDNEVVGFAYNSNNEIIKIIIPKLNRYVSFTYDESKKTVKIEVYYEKDNIKESIKSITLEFSNNTELSKVIDNKTGEYLKILQNSHNLTVYSVGLYNSDGSKIAYKNIYDFYGNVAKVKDIEGNIVRYEFDNNKRIRTIVDNKAHTISYSYDFKGNLISQSKEQTNSRNLIENNSFENEDIFKAWVKGGSSATIMESIKGGIYGERCLEVKTQGNEEASISQKIVNIKGRSYVLSGFIKHSGLSYVTNKKISIGIYAKYTISSNTFQDRVLVSLDNTNSGWYKFISPTLTIPSAAKDIELDIKLIVDHVTTTVYLDELQLTNGDYVTRYNLIENGYMDFIDEKGLPKNWEIKNFESEDKVIEKSEDSDTFGKIIGNKVLRIKENKENKVKMMSQRLNIKGLAGDTYVYSLISKSLTTANTIYMAYIRIIYEEGGSETFSYNLERNSTVYNQKTIEVRANKDYKGIEVGIRYNGNNEAYFDCFQLYRDTYGNTYSYDDKGNIIEAKDSKGRIQRAIYDEDNKVSSMLLGEESNYIYEYDSKGRLIEVRDIKGNIVEISYNEDDEVVRTLINNEIENKVIYDKENKKEKNINSYGHEEEIEKDEVNNIIRVTSPNGLITNYQYNKRNELIEVKEGEEKHTLSYDEKGNISGIKVEGGSGYQISYDTFGSVLKVKKDNVNIEQNEYDEIKDGYNKGLLVKRTYGEKGAEYNYQYDSKGRVVKFLIGAKEKERYVYDENDNIYEKEDVERKEKTYYTYDMNNRLVYERNNKGESKRYVYDNKGNLQQKSVNGVVTNYQYSYERGEGRKERYINKIIETYKDEVVISSYKGQGLYGARKEYSVNEYEKDKELNMYVMVFNNKNSFVQYRSSSFNKYKDKNWQERYKENNTFYMWVKFIGEIGTENLVRFRKDTQEIASVSVDSEGRLSYNEGKIKTQGKVRLNEWNLVGVRQLKEGVSLILNDEITKQINLQIKIKEIDNVVISDQQGTKEMKMIINVSYMFFSAYRYTNNQISILYKEGKESLVKKEEEEKANLTIYYDEKVYKGYDVITLCGSIESGKGNRAQRIEESQEENIYKYDKGSGKLIYGCYSGDKNKLSYNLNMRLSGTISLMFKLKENIVKERTIISNRLQEIEELGIKITSDKKVKIIVNDESEILETKVTENKWNNVIVSYSGTKLEIYLNGEKIRSKSDKVISLSYCETYIGIDPKEEESELEGQVEMLAYKGSGVIDAVEASSISKNGRSKVIKEKYDELGKKESSEIEGYKVSYRYEKERIESEIDDSHEVIKYEYEKGSNRVSKKIRLFDNVVEREERYQYDSKGQIVKEIRNKEEINYSYDKEGNLIKENNKEYIYNSGRLVRVVEGNTLIQEIMYDGTKDKYKPINLIVNGSREDLRYEGRRLIGIGKDISYEYDGEGRRISKTVKGNKEEYKYEGERLVKIIKEGREIEVLYDIKGEIVGLKNEEGYYYYRKDALGNIERIIDSTGKTIVKYEYSVWGELIEEKKIENKKIVEDNPYKYKSYYYDKESGLYYLKSRYYSASLHRFISLDQTEYMEIGSITGLNLYVYCGNDPVNMADPDGCFWDTVFDVAFITWEIYDLVNGGYKDWKNWVALGIDVIFAVIPFVQSGAGQVIKVGNKIDDTVDVANAINKIDNIKDMSKVTMIGRSMDRVTDTAKLIGKADNLYVAWKGFDATATGLKRIVHNGISMIHDAGWMFGKLRSGYTVIDIGMTTLHKGRGLYYGAERFVIILWKTRNIWKLPINYYS